MRDLGKVVFDCNTFLQAMAAPEGQAGKCMRLEIAQRRTMLKTFVKPIQIEG
jgi:hypothetical protein